MKNFAIRTVKKGQVKINGDYYKPRDSYIKGELDGKRYAFGLYWRGTKYENFVSLWGSEQAFKTGDDWPGDNCIENTFYWIWWDKINEK